MRAVCLAALLLLVAAGPGWAQDKTGGDVVYSKKDQSYKPREGEYGGVTPGVIYPYADEGYKNRRKWMAPARMPKNTIFWVGYQPKEGGATRVFLQASGPLEYSQAVRGGALIVSLPGARLANSNARRRLDARVFESAVTGVHASRVRTRRARRGRAATKAGVEVRVTFKKPADASEARAGFTKEADGYHYLYLDFGSVAP
jgi:hypothetical protein